MQDAMEEIDEHSNKRDWIGSESLIGIPEFGDTRKVEFYAGTNTEVLAKPAPKQKIKKSSRESAVPRKAKKTTSYAESELFDKDEIFEEEQYRLSIASVEKIGLHLDMIDNNPEEFEHYAKGRTGLLT